MNNLLLLTEVEDSTSVRRSKLLDYINAAIEAFDRSHLLEEREIAINNYLGKHFCKRSNPQTGPPGHRPVYSAID